MYKLIKSPTTGEINAVTIVGQNICIPMDADNTDYQAFLLWKSQGNEPLPAESN